MSTLPPPRWLKCPRRGQIVACKFIPFKTPLDSKFDMSVDEEDRFPPSLLFSFLEARGLEMGLVVDLTNTNRFYSKDQFQTRSCNHVKLQCKGHGECPTPEQTSIFLNICNKYIHSNADKIIGVHCTHGFNRTGFLIAAYLIERMDWTVEEAVGEIKRSRPPGIYKADYLKELFRRYGDEADAPPAPTLPDWCAEEERDDDSPPPTDEGASHNNRGSRVAPLHHRKRGREVNKTNVTFFEGVTGVGQTDLSTQDLVRNNIAELCRWQRSGFTGSQPVSMTLQNLTMLKDNHYKVSWKADGTRYMMLIDGFKHVYLVDRDNTVFHTPQFVFPLRKSPESHLKRTLLDGEMISDKVEGRTISRYLVYDIIKFNGIDVGGTDFDRRLLCIDREIIETRIDNPHIDKLKEPFSIRRKPFWDLSATRSLVVGNFSKVISHETDGLIFQPQKDPYKCGRCDNVLKWKPPMLNSVDFKLQIKTLNQQGCPPVKQALLYVGGHDMPFAQMKVTAQLRELNNCIIECCFQDNEWKFMRQRTDKSYPNAHSTAMAVCNSIIEPVTQEILFHFIDTNSYNPLTHTHTTDNQKPPLKKARTSSTNNSPHPGADTTLMPPPAQR